MHYLVFLWTPFSLFGVGVYISKMLKGEVKPNKVTRLLRAIANLISAGAMFAGGVTRAAVPTLVGGIVCLSVVIVASFVKQAYRKLWLFDYICGACAVLALGLRAITKQPVIAIVFSIIGNLFSSIPTFKKSRTHPETENVAPYLTGLVNPATTFFAVKHFSFTEIAFPIYVLMSNLAFVILILRGRGAKTLKASWK